MLPGRRGKTWKYLNARKSSTLVQPLKPISVSGRFRFPSSFDNHVLSHSILTVEGRGNPPPTPTCFQQSVEKTSHSGTRSSRHLEKFINHLQVSTAAPARAQRNQRPALSTRLEVHVLKTDSPFGPVGAHRFSARISWFFSLTQTAQPEISARKRFLTRWTRSNN